MANECTFRSSSLVVIVNPEDRADETNWSFKKDSSIYSLPVRLIENASTGNQYRVDLEARGALSLSESANLDEEARELSNNVERLIADQVEKTPNIRDLCQSLFQKPFQTKPHETIQFNFKIAEIRPPKMNACTGKV